MDAERIGQATRWQPENVGALVHGLRSDRYRAAVLAEHADAVRERETAILDDLGGPDAVATVKRHLVNPYVELSLMAESILDALVVGGPLTSRGRQKALFMAYLSVVDRLQRLAHTIGLERRQKPAQTLDEYLRERAARQAADVAALAAQAPASGPSAAPVDRAIETAPDRVPGAGRPAFEGVLDEDEAGT